MVAVTLGVTAGDLDVAREALRDGLWEIARRHAVAAGDGDEARLIVLESLAREERWSELLATLEKDGNPSQAGFVYYRALALFHTGEGATAKSLMDGMGTVSGDLAGAAARLRSAMASAAGDDDSARALLKPFADGGDVDAMMMLAGICARKGENDDAGRLYRAVLATTNAPAMALAVSAANLSDVASLRRIYSSARGQTVRRFAGFRLGRILIRDRHTFDEGSKLIRTLARSAPDDEGARAAFRDLAEELLERGEFKLAAASFADLLEMWPDSARDAVVQEGRGWAFDGLGRTDDALEALRLALTLSDDRAFLDTVEVKIADILSRCGRIDAATAAYRAFLSSRSDSSLAGRVKESLELLELEERGRKAFAAYRFDEAAKAFAEVAEKDALTAPRMEYFTLMCFYGQGRDAEAEAKAKTLADTCKDAEIRAEAMLWLAKFSYNRGRFPEAMASFTAYVDRLPTADGAAGALVWAARAAFAAGQFARAVQLVTRLVSDYPVSSDTVDGMLIQGEALIELARFDEAVLALERVALAETAAPAVRRRAGMLRGDALFAMGADNPVRYQEAGEAYAALGRDESLTVSQRILIAYKIARTEEKLRHVEEAMDMYYSRVVIAYRDARLAGERIDEDTRAAFSRAAFRLADEYESRGRDAQAEKILVLVEKSDVPAAAEARRRIRRLQEKGRIL